MSEIHGEKKLFSILDGRDICIAPGVQKLPATAVSTLLDCRGMLERVQEDALAYRKQVAKECDALKEEAEKAGFQSGYEKWTEMVSLLEKEIVNVRQELQKVVMPVAVKAAKKIVTTELSVNPGVISDIVLSTLKTVAQHKRVVIYVSKEDYSRIESEKAELKKVFDELESLSIRERDDIDAGGCVVETEGGIINARIKDRWRTLEAALEALAATLTQGK